MNDQELLEQLQRETGAKLERVPFDELLKVGGNRYAADENGRITGLILYNTKLKTFPKSLLQLTNLQALFLIDNQLTALPANIGRLANLTTLYVYGNKLTALPADIGRLANLTELNVFSNQLTALPADIGRLANLTTLDVSSNQLTALPAEIGRLANLTTLKVFNNQLTALPAEIGRLANLTTLVVSDNELTALPAEIGRLTNLTTLDVAYNQIKQLPRSMVDLNHEFCWVMTYKHEQGINLYENPLESPPVEIVKQGRAAVVNFFRSVAESKETVRLHEAKLLIVGRGEVGKTCVMKKLLDPKFQFVLGTEPTTEGIDIKEWRFPAKRDNEEFEFTAHCWDFGGQAIYHATHQFFLTKRSFYLFIWDARKDEEYPAIDYWLNVIKLLGDASPAFMALNKCDVRVSEIDQASIQKKFPNVERFFQVSARTGEGMDALRDAVGRRMATLDHIGDELPKAWLDIRRELESLPDDFISYERFKEVCAKHDLDAERAAFLSDYFHDLGAFLHFRNDLLLEELVILKPEWGTDAVYAVLDDKEVRARKGRFASADLERIWEKKRYPPDKRAHLIKLMEKFELCFRIKNEYVAPELLAAEVPAYAWDETDNLRFEYRYEFMPAGILTRFIVRQHENIRGNPFWKNGTLLEFDNARAKVVLEPLNRRIKIAISGVNKKEALYHVRNDIAHIHDTLNNPEVQQMVPCICKDCAQSDSPKMFDYKELRQYQEAGEKEIVCTKERIKKVQVDELLSGIRYEPPTGPWQAFLSYSRQDRDTIKRVVADLKQRNISYWLDDEQIKPGDSISRKIEDGLRNSRHVMPCVSKNQLASGWSRAEYQSVLSKVIGKKSAQKVTPLILDDTTAEELPSLLYDYKAVRLDDAEDYARLLDFLARG